MMTEVDQFRQEKSVWSGVSIISFPSFRFVTGEARLLHSGDVVQGSGGCGPPER